ncbi:MAG: chemotaxis protein CheA [Desulfitobacteriaceae bacterium]|nr:chemotaxis protein CheA [Desulfitobacteriaceae bacterium]MDI6878887.1 chemotaxis protein CheA [Desulfitobacteriaceae bacterium]MDI6914492.1 chemotaxis protein CheA [Desulfitobacteriaceae bacterium]
MGQDDKKNQGVDLEEFLEFYLLDSQEQIDKLGTGLLQLEKGGSNIGLINDLFRSAHSLKGASGTMGFTPIVALTHAAEDLLDRLRQGKIEVTLTMIDMLLDVTDRVKVMLSQVEQRQAINVEYEDLVKAMKDLVSGKLPLEQGAGSQAFANGTEPGEQAGGAEHGGETEIAFDKEDGFVPFDFQLSNTEWKKLGDAQNMGHGIYQVDVALAPNTLMKAVRAVMAVQRVENLGAVVKLLPTVEDLEIGNGDDFFLLVISDEAPEEIMEEILGVSEIAKVMVHAYPATPEDMKAQGEGTMGGKEAAAGAAILEGVLARVSQPEVNVAKDNRLVGAPAQATSQGRAQVGGTAPAGNASAQAGNDGGEGNTQVHTIRVDTARMDNLINLVGEMVITRTRLVQVGLDLKSAYKMDPLVSNLIETNVYLGRLMNDLQESVMRLRMVPIGTVFNRFPRLVRDLARKTNKEMDLVLQGEDTELDKTVVEVIGDPLMHLIRNSVDHGIESPEERQAAGKPVVGKITLDAYHEGNHIAILVSDDGAGLPLASIRRKAIERGWIGEREELSDRDIANLIFLPGLSTAEMVTDISGRGVGMDVVKKALNNLGGMIDIDTRRGQGTTFIIRLPLTLAIIQALLVEVGAEIYAVPLSSVLETLLVNRTDIKTVGGLPMVQLRGNTLPLISLQEKFELPAPEVPSEEVFVVVVGLGDKALGLVVDTLRGQQEIVIKSLGDMLNNLPGIAGATILGDGKVTLILDIGSLIQDVLVTRKS